MNDAHRREYERISGEYYDADLHPTCANFRDGSLQVLRRWTQALADDEPLNVICEVGAGRAVFLDLSELAGQGRARIVSDESQGMLAYSDDVDGNRLVATAFDLPLKDGSVSLLIASLGDPYNALGFWREGSRVVVPGGSIWFTTPSLEWASGFRPAREKNTALFETREHGVVSTSSTILARSEQVALAEKCGFALAEESECTVSELTTPLSPKLSVLRSDAAVVSAYWFRRLH